MKCQSLLEPGGGPGVQYPVELPSGRTDHPGRQVLRPGGLLLSQQLEHHLRLGLSDSSKYTGLSRVEDLGEMEVKTRLLS